MGDINYEIISEDFIEGFCRRYPTHVLEILLCDRTTGKNIIWADNEYEALGNGYTGDDEITTAKILGISGGVIKPRIAKETEQKSQRTKSRAEVFTPSWLVNQMNNDIDQAWFGRRDVFNIETVGDDGARGWSTTSDPVAFPATQEYGWQAYVQATKLEITCGEAPFVCSRYDTVTAHALPVAKRVGFLDRKLRVVGENTTTRQDWTQWALEALKATYAFEYQGDNLLIARINVLETFAEHLYERWGEAPTLEEIEQAACVVSWNLWQMNGFNDAVPTNKTDVQVTSTLGNSQVEPKPVQLSLFELFDSGLGDGQKEETTEDTCEKVPLCVIYNWKTNEPFEFASLKGKETTMGKIFYAVIGNPPYQSDKDDNGRKPPIYNYFMDESYKVAEKVELITPARFLFDAGQTPKEWNRKMLSDPHFKVVEYEPDASVVFYGVDIKGGVAVTYRNSEINYGEIGTFVAFEELQSALKKVKSFCDESISNCITGAVPYRYTEKAVNEHPDCVELMGGSLDLRTNAFDKLYSKLFFSDKQDDSNFIGIVGLYLKKRECLYIRRDYIDVPDNFEQYKVLVPESNGSGALGEVLSTPLIGQPLIGHTQTFISIGSFDTEEEANACLKYIETKFARAMLGVLKVTQHNAKAVWKYVPLQDFTEASDIDWSKSIPEIDRQLYAKYGLDQSEIEFIETHVKEMN